MSSPTPNTLTAINVALSGPFYAFDASGGFVMEQGFTTVAALPDSSFNNFDVTNALQVVLDVSYLNGLLNLVKDYSAESTFGQITTTSYDSTTQEFDVSSITITAAAFKTNLPHYQRIISVGAYANMYTNFENYVKQYFGYPGGFASLFDQATSSLFDLSSNDFDNIHKLLVPTVTTAGETEEGDENVGNYTTDLSGNIIIHNITKLLRFAVDTNVFGNRAAGTSADPSGNLVNFGVGDGFMAGDLIYVATGTQITIDLDIQSELFIDPFNNPNTSVSSTFSGINTTSISTDAAITTLAISGDYSSISSITRNNIKRVLKAPLLIRLVNPLDLPAPPA